MKSKIGSFIAAIAAIATTAAVQASEIAVTIDGASPGRVFEGVGALSAGASSRLLIEYPSASRSATAWCCGMSASIPLTAWGSSQEGEKADTGFWPVALFPAPLRKAL